jgi:predicted nucleic acid-binding protein
MTNHSGKHVLAIDTMVLIWGLESSGSRDLLKRTNWLFTELDRAKARVLVSSISVAEFLVRVPPELHPRTLAELSSRFDIAAFDARCAPLAAALRAGAREKGQPAPGDRRVVSSDAMIVASVKFAGATRLYSADEGCRRMADAAGLRGLDIPTIGPSLWEA